MNKSLLCLGSIVGASALSFCLGLFTKSDVKAGLNGQSELVAILVATLTVSVLLYIGLTDSEIRRAAHEEKALRSQESVRMTSELRALTETLGGLRISPQIANPSVSTASAESGMNEAVGVLAKDLAAREKETSRLVEIIRRKDSRNILARVATIRETSEFTRRINAAGKLDDKEALNQLHQEIEAAMEDLGMEILHVAKGTRISELPSGSFTVLHAAEPETPESAGTVRESLSDAVFVTDESGRQVFVSPAKLRVYKL